jgi:ribonuclease HI
VTLDPSEGIALFTDGSAWTGDRIGGWAWVALDAFGNEDAGYGCASDTTNNRMEMQAWIEGLIWTFKACGSCEVLVYSDSEYVGLGAMNRRRARKINLDLWDDLDKAIDLHPIVEFVHVKGHGDSYYNDLVDVLAGEARALGQRELLPVT